MSCEIFGASSPYQETSFFEDEWKECMGEDEDVGSLQAIANFNATFDNDSGFGLDPQLLSNPSSPGSSNNSTTIITSKEEFSQNQKSNTMPEVLDMYPAPDFGQPVSTPYYHQSIEFPTASTPPPQQLLYQPSPLRNQLHRRSVSEPPTGPSPDGHHYQVPSPPNQPFFHRQGHYLGTPQTPNNGHKLKSFSRNKPPPRHHPYPPAAAKRGQVKRSQTQPGRPPTSTPLPPQPPLGASMPPAPYMSSRVCTPGPTPVPSPEHTASPIQMHGLPVPAMVQKSSISSERTVSIPLAVDELRAMITDAVQKAVDGIERARTAEGDATKSNHQQDAAEPEDGNVDDDDDAHVGEVEPKFEELMSMEDIDQL